MTKVAKDAGLSLSAMSKIEKGVRRLNQNQLLRLCDLLGCKISDVFIKASDDVAAAWQTEMQKRLSSNEDGGLKIFGAGIRFLRKRANITIAGAAKLAKMSLSVYHKIEVGQRGIFEPEVQPLAAIFGLDENTLFSEIAALYKSGKLGKFIQKTEQKVKSVMTPNKSQSGVNIDGALYGASIYDSVRQKLVPVFAEMNGNGELAFVKSDERMIAAPSGLEGRDSVYAVRPDNRMMGPIFPKDAYVFVDSAVTAKAGDLAVYLSDDFANISDNRKTTARVVLVELDERGKPVGRAAGDVVVPIKSASARLHKIMQIVMG